MRGLRADPGERSDHSVVNLKRLFRVPSFPEPVVEQTDKAINVRSDGVTVAKIEIEPGEDSNLIAWTLRDMLQFVENDAGVDIDLVHRHQG